MKTMLRKVLLWAAEQLDPEEPKERRVEIAIATCVACQAPYREELAKQLPLVSHSRDKTKSGDNWRTEKRRCACGAVLNVDWQHVEEHEYSMPQPMYDRLYG